MMLKNALVAVLIFLFSVGSGLVSAQTPDGGVKPSYLMGDVTAISETKIVLQTKTGEVDVGLTDKTDFKRVSPDNPSLKTAVAAALSDIAVGDKLTVTGILSADGKSIPARAVYLMTKSEIAQKKAKDTAEWRTRGINGKVVSVNPQTNQINIEVRGPMGNAKMTLTPKEQAKFLRYSPDSIKFDDAKSSSIGEVQAGDVLRAIGDKNADGTAFAAEQVLTGAFQQLTGTVKSVDAEKNEVVIKDIVSAKDITVVLSNTSLLKKFPPEMAERMAMSQMGGASGGIRPAGQGASPVQPVTPAGQGTSPGVRPPGAGPRPAGGGMDDMFERLPDIKAADLKVGDVISLSSSRNAVTDRVKALRLVAGVEPFLKAAQAAAGGQRGPGVQPNIPGLDGIGLP